MSEAGFDEIKRGAFVKPSWDLCLIALESKSKEIYVRKSFIEQIWKEAQKDLLGDLQKDLNDLKANYSDENMDYTIELYYNKLEDLS